jgi:hypothetical protein
VLRALEAGEEAVTDPQSLTSRDGHKMFPSCVRPRLPSRSKVAS